MGNGTLWIILVAFVLVYFFFMRPKKKKEQEANSIRNNIRVGDEITTVDGIIGEIVSIKDETVVIETGKARTRIRILRNAIANVDVRVEDK